MRESAVPSPWLQHAEMVFRETGAARPEAVFSPSPECCLCFTGHRLIPEAERAALSRLLDQALDDAFREGKRFFLSGGALGFDTIAAMAVLRLKEREPAAGLILALPCRSQADRWSAPDRETYRFLLDRADRVIFVSDEYFEGCMQKRNRFLVDHAAACFCYLRSCRGGTWYTVSYAYDQGRSIRNLADELRRTAPGAGS